jgi:hypothetical protein
MTTLLEMGQSNMLETCQQRVNAYPSQYAIECVRCACALAVFTCCVHLLGSW